MLAGLALLGLLAAAGETLRVAAGLPVPGAAIGLTAYLLLLATGRFDWSLAAAMRC